LADLSRQWLDHSCSSRRRRHQLLAARRQQVTSAFHPFATLAECRLQSGHQLRVVTRHSSEHARPAQHLRSPRAPCDRRYLRALACRRRSVEKTYWLSRKRASLKMAQNAAGSESRLIHYDLAGRYGLKAGSAETQATDLARSVPAAINANRSKPSSDGADDA
jgi:hypothetical protein